MLRYIECTEKCCGDVRGGCGEQVRIRSDDVGVNVKGCVGVAWRGVAWRRWGGYAMSTAAGHRTQRINTFVALDLETTGLPWQEHNRTRVTELALVAMSRENMIATNAGLPRVMHKLTFCVNPFRMIQPDATHVTGLSNEILEKEKTFDEDACEMINLFLSRQIPPVCIVAHNGNKFDFPILRSEMMRVSKTVPDDVLCIDSYIAFQQLFNNIPLEMLPQYIQKRRNSPKETKQISHYDTMNENITVGSSKTATSFRDSFISPEDRTFMQKINERTPEQIGKTGVSTSEVLKVMKAKKKLFTDDATDTQPQLKSFKLCDIYKFLSGKNAIDTHRAENDALILTACITILGQNFTEWSEENAVPFNTIKGIR